MLTRYSSVWQQNICKLGCPFSKRLLIRDSHSDKIVTVRYRCLLLSENLTFASSPSMKLRNNIGTSLMLHKSKC